jgi:hypothetical protein
MLDTPTSEACEQDPAKCSSNAFDGTYELLMPGDIPYASCSNASFTLVPTGSTEGEFKATAENLGNCNTGTGYVACFGKDWPGQIFATAEGFEAVMNMCFQTSTGVQVVRTVPFDIELGEYGAMVGMSQNSYTPGSGVKNVQFELDGEVSLVQ